MREGSAEDLSSHHLELEISSPHTLQTSGSLLPLTEANLATLGDSPHPEAMPSTLHGSQSDTAASNTLAAVRDRLEQHGILINKFDVYKQHPVVQQAVDNILKVESPSVMRQQSASKVIEKIDEHAVSQENTLFTELWPLIFKTRRQVLEGESWIDHEWKEDGLWANRDVPFKRQTVSALPRETDAEKAYYNSRTPLSDAKPDWCFGLAKEAFTSAEMKQVYLVDRPATVQDQLYFGFGVVEDKGPARGIAESINQAAHSGSTLVEASRLVQQAAGRRDPRQVGADSENIVFSVCMEPTSSQLFVHWALRDTDQSLYYHMTRLDSYDNLKMDRLIVLRHNIYRIMDWGLLGRKQWIKGMLPYIKPQPIEKKEPASKKAKTNSGAASVQGSSTKE